MKSREKNEDFFVFHNNPGQNSLNTLIGQRIREGAAPPPLKISSIGRIIVVTP